MGKYIILCNWTEQGIKDVKGFSDRMKTAKGAMSQMGITGEIYMTMGSYDLVFIGDAPNDKAVTKMLLMLGQAGNVRSTTLKAFNQTEAAEIIASLP